MRDILNKSVSLYQFGSLRSPVKQEALNIKNLESYLGPIGFTLIGAVAPLNWVLLSKILRGIKVRRNIVRFILALSLSVLSACAPTRSIWDKNGAGQTIPRSDMKLSAEYFRIDPRNPSLYWWDQDVIVKGDVVKDMVKPILNRPTLNRYREH